MIALLFLTTIISSPVLDSAHPARRIAPQSQAGTLKDWALARCIARGAKGPFAQDAASSAAALLERGDYGIEAYNALDMLIGQQLAKRYGGSVPGDYVTLKCLDLYHSVELDRLTARQKATPVR